MPLSHRIRTVAATALLTVVGCSAVLAVAGPSFAATSHTRNPRAVQCRINFQASSLNLRVGQDLVLSWTTVGADKLTASWTSGYVPFVGTVTTTMAKAGTFSYQVTGTANGVYCGGAGVQVKFTSSAAASSSAAPAPSTSRAGSSSAASTSVAGNGNTASSGGGFDPGFSSTASVKAGASPIEFTSTNSKGANGYPIQSPTSGSGVPWYEDPTDLLAISAVALMSSLLLWRREQLRAVFFTRRH